MTSHSNGWKVVSKRNRSKSNIDNDNDLLFSFDEDISCKQTPVHSKKSPRYQVDKSSNHKSHDQKKHTASSLPETRSLKWVPKNRRNRSRSTKAQHASYALLDSFTVAKYEAFKNKALKGN